SFTAGAGFPTVAQSVTGAQASNPLTVQPEYQIAHAVGTPTATGTITNPTRWAAAIGTYMISFPAVTAITRADADNPPPGSTVHFTATVNQSVSNVGASDFALATTGSISGASI